MTAVQDPVRMDAAERLACLRLIRTENVGPIAYRELLARFGSAGRALEALPGLARRGGRPGLRICPRADAERELEALTRLGGRIVVAGEPEYPAALAVLNDSPPLIAVAGDVDLVRRRGVAVVGARNASANGRRFAEDLARQLGAAGLVVVSGLARGIDAAAHRGALDSGTVAVLAGGLDVVYPPEHAELQRAIAARGALVAEQPLGTVPQARHFPRRNRVISGLALGVVVVEAAERSGSLITARLALEQGRQVMAVPGSPLDPRCRGANRLIRDDGAVLVQSAADVIESLEGSILPGPGERARGTATGAEAPLFAPEEAPADARALVESRLGASPVAVDELVRQCQLSSAVVQTVLLELELAGRLERHPGNRISLILGG
ncbi:MAG: DNA-protecting protein DprA, partial [Rhodospirillaceae bacterium]|nr:DNA-protecting protein DprA [Rhodospirillaceae bacterium]